MREINEIILLLEDKLDYCFSDKELIIEALSHPSLNHSKNKIIYNYERLEFLGDSILNFIITEYIFNKLKNHNEGSLAKIRSSLVCKDTIFKIAKNLELNNYIIMSDGEEKSGGRVNPNNLENSMEAIIAAIYLDSNITQITKIILKLWAEYLNSDNKTIIDPKSSLQEWSQGKSMSAPSYEVIEKTGKSHNPMFKVKLDIDGKYSEYGEGKSIKAAEKEAALKLLNKIMK